MKKLFIFGFMAIMAAACGGKAASAEETKTTEETPKEEPKKEEKKSTAQQLLGTWKIFSVSGEELSEKEKQMTITFKEDGTAKTTGNNEESMKWEVKETDGKAFLIVTTSKKEENEIKSIDDKKLVLIDKGTEITLTKQ